MRFLLPNQRIHPQRKRLFFGLLLLLILGTDQLKANDRVAASTLVDRAGVTLRNFIRDPEMAWFRGHIKESSGLLIVPRLRQAGFIIGGAGGNGVLLWRGESAAACTGPAFYTLHLTPTEAQSDTEATELVLLVRSDTGREALLKIKLEGPALRLVGFEMAERGVPRAEYPVAINGQVVGIVTTGMKSPTSERFVGLAYVPAASAALGSQIDIVIRDVPKKATVVKTPFYVAAYRR